MTPLRRPHRAGSPLQGASHLFALCRAGKPSVPYIPPMSVLIKQSNTLKSHKTLTVWCLATPYNWGSKIHNYIEICDQRAHILTCSREHDVDFVYVVNPLHLLHQGTHCVHWEEIQDHPTATQTPPLPEKTLGLEHAILTTEPGMGWLVTSTPPLDVNVPPGLRLISPAPRLTIAMCTDRC